MPWSRATGATTSATAPVAAEIMAGRPPTIAMVQAIVKEAKRPMRGSTPAMIEKEIASGISARATTRPASSSVFRRRGLRRAASTEVSSVPASGTRGKPSVSWGSRCAGEAGAEVTGLQGQECRGGAAAAQGRIHASGGAGPRRYRRDGRRARGVSHRPPRQLRNIPATDMGAGEPLTRTYAGDRLSDAHLCRGVRGTMAR